MLHQGNSILKIVNNWFLNSHRLYGCLSVELYIDFLLYFKERIVYCSLQKGTAAIVQVLYKEKDINNTIIISAPQILYCNP